jgi:hypothetical protein
LATTFSLYCALERATEEVTGFEHRGAVMQEARFVIDEIAANRNDFQHRLQGFNNSTETTFDDIQKVIRLLEDRIQKRLAEQVRPAHSNTRSLGGSSFILSMHRTLPQTRLSGA